MIQEKIRQLLGKVLTEMQVSVEDISVDVPSDMHYGDYSSNVAFIAAKQMKKNPLVLAEEIVKKLQASKFKFPKFEKVEAVKPGFINFTLSNEHLIDIAVRIITDEKSLAQEIQVSQPKFEMYENTQPNTNKPLHIGHLRNMTLAGALVNLRKALGHKVWSININNDRGIHIIKAMWAYLEFGKNEFKNMEEVLNFDMSAYSKRNRGSNFALAGADLQSSSKRFQRSLDTSSKFEQERENLTKRFEAAYKPTPAYAELRNWKDLLKEWIENKNTWKTPESNTIKSDHFVGMFYLLGDRAEKQYAEVATSQMKEMLLSWESGEESIRALWEMMNGWFYRGFKETHARFLGIKASDPQFDYEWYESDVYDKGKKIVMENLGKGVFVKRDDGAIVAKLEKYHLPEKVVIRSDGSSLYMTQDIELERQRIKEFHADLVCIIIGNEQELYFKQVFAIQDALGVASLDHFLCLTYGMVNRAGGIKMSSRVGNVIAIDDLLELIKAKIAESFKTEDDTIIEEIALGAIKYTLLKNNLKGDMSFDMDESVSLDGNSGPYIQYTYARTRSVLRKGKGLRGLGEVFKDYQLNAEEADLARLISHYYEVLRVAATGYAPHLITTYLFTLAKSFNLFYQKHRILEAKSDQEKQLRVMLVEAVSTVLKNGLGVLGIAAPAKM